MCLRYHSHEAPKEMQVKSHDDVTKFVEKYYDMEDIDLSVSTTHVIQIGGVTNIEKKEYKISIPDKWCLQFVMYVPKSDYRNFNEYILPISVYHTHDVEAFRHFGDSMDSMMFAIWIHQNTTSANISTTGPIDTENDVFIGKKDGLDVFMKRVPRSEVVPLKVYSLWSSSNHDKFLEFHGVYTDDTYHYFIFEHCEYNLHEFLKHLTNIDLKKKAARDLVYLFIYQEDVKGVCHTNSNAWNVMVTKDGMLKLSGFNLKPWSSELSVKNRRTLGELIALFSKGKPKHPWEYEVRNAAKLLDDAKSLAEISVHPILWDDWQHVEFYTDAYDLLKQKSQQTRRVQMKDESVRVDLFGFMQWLDGVPEKLFEQQQKTAKTKYQTDDPYDLLRFIRNILSHFKEVASGVDLTSGDRALLGSDRTMADFGFRLKFPWFKTGLHDFIREVPEDERKSLERYYQMDEKGFNLWVTNGSVAERTMADFRFRSEFQWFTGLHDFIREKVPEDERKSLKR